MQVGFVGLGAMGLPMARRLLQAGHALTVYNRSRSPVQVLAEEGAREARSAEEVAAASEVVFTMLPSEAAVLEVTLGEASVVTASPPAAVLVDCSTVSPSTVTKMVVGLIAHGTQVVDAPVSGGVLGAEAGSLAIMAGGSPGTVGRVWPLLETLGSTVVHVGPSGAGQTVKAANQVVVASILQGLSEAIVLLDAAGADTSAALDAIGGGLGASRVLEHKKASLLARDFTPSGRAELHHKDLGIALAIARAHDVSLPVTALVDQFFAALAAQGRSGWDHSALLALADQMSGSRHGRQGG
jgi:2-hydroxy-3-oxopropionate reductase